MKIAIAQINTSVGDVEGNTAKIIDYISRAKQAGAKIVVFPEMAIPGYPPKDLLLSDDFIWECQSALLQIQAASKGISVIVGGVEKKGGKLYNSAFVLDNGERAYTYHKKHLPNYDVFDEKRYFESGENGGVFELAGKKIGLNICEDIWVDPGVVEAQHANGAELVINISASPFYYGKTEERKALIKSHIARTGLPIVYANQAGGQDDIVFDGESYAFSPDCRLLAQGRHFQEDLIVFSTNGKRIEEKTHTIAEEVYEALKAGLRDFVHKQGFRKAVLGLSGGVDSALVAAIAADALGAENVTCVFMPTKHSSEQSRADAGLLAKNLGVNYKVCQIADSYKAVQDEFTHAFGIAPADITDQNFQARLRMIPLYAYANQEHALVLNTSNKSESAVGYGTMYGDMAGDYAVISDVPKTLVYKLCSHVNELAGWSRIPSSILTKAPSAELKPDQLDSDNLPPYEILDKIIHMYVEEVKSPAQIMREGIGREMVRDVIKRINAAEHKRKKMPPGTKITPCAFGTGRRMPIANGQKI